jgi:hypothetical protein
MTPGQVKGKPGVLLFFMAGFGSWGNFQNISGYCVTW